MFVYLTLSGNVENFLDCFKHEVDLDDNLLREINYSSREIFNVGREYILVTPTYDDDLTDYLGEFIEYGDNLDNLLGVVGSGNTNFDDDYCFNAKDLSKKYNKPLIHTFELSGNQSELEIFKKEVNKYWNHLD